MKKLLLFVLSLIFVISFTNCKKTNQETIKIGAIFSVSGANAFLGEPEKNTALMIVENFKKRYPDKKIELLIYDDEGDATKAQNYATKLIEEENVVAVIGPTISGASLKIIDIALDNNTPLISCAAAASIVEPVSERKWIFKTAQSDKLAVNKLFKYISSQGIKDIAIITVSNGFGQSGKTFLEELAKEFNINIVENQTFGSQDTDMKSQLTKIKSSNPEIIICWGTNPGPAYIVRNAKELGINIPIYQSHGVGNNKYIELAGDSVEGTFLVAGKLLVCETLNETDLQKNVLLKYSEDYKAMFKEDPSTFGGHGYDAITLVLNAIESGILDGKEIGEQREALRDYLENVKNFVGVTGIFNFSETDHNGLDETSFAIIKIKDGKWNFVE